MVHFSYNSAILRRRQTLLQRVPLSVFTFSRKHTQPDVPKGSPLWIFFGILRLKKYFFFEKNFKNNFFENFFFQIFTIVVPWIFLSLRYGADLGRSRLVFFCFFQLTISLWVVHFSYNSAILRRRQTLLQRVPLSVFTFSRKHTQPDVPKGSPLWIFFGTVRLFFEKIFIVPKGSPLRVFSYFATECMLIHHKGSPLLHFSALCDFFWKNFFFQKFMFFSKKIFLRFLSLRYGADFGRSRLVFKLNNGNSVFSRHILVENVPDSYSG